MKLPFRKMHGLGNDFVILDKRTEDFVLSKEEICLMADRHLGIGCDQLVVLENSENADIFMRFFNSDGSEAGACGNASRCIGRLLMEEQQKESVLLETQVGVLAVYKKGDEISVEMGEPDLNWAQIPLNAPADTLAIDTGIEGLPLGVAVSMGNPHLIFFVDSLEKIDIPVLGPQIETSSLFPEKTNVGFAQLVGKNEIKLRYWERGAGLTLACGSGACATAVAAVRRHLTDKNMRIHFEKGSLHIACSEGAHKQEGSEEQGYGQIVMTGSASYVYEGNWERDGHVS